jgi:hypothetical protein
LSSKKGRGAPEASGRRDGMKDLKEIKEKIRQHLISGEYLLNMRTMDKEKLRKDIVRSMIYIISIERLSVPLKTVRRSLPSSSTRLPALAPSAIF